MQPDDDLFSEARLRRALRLEAGELPPRLDMDRLVAHAHQSRRAPAAVLSGGLAAVAFAVLTAVALPAVSALVPGLAAGAFEASLDAVERIAVALQEFIALAQEPSTPIAAVAALVLAAAYEYRLRKERADAITAS